MKKNFFGKLFSLILTIVLTISFSVFKASAINDYNQYIFDEANMLTQHEWDTLNQYARSVSETYGCAVHILTTDDPSVNEYTINQYAEDTYLRYIDFGWGAEKDGYMLVMATSDRSYTLIAYGPKGNYTLTDYGKDLMASEFLDNFRNNDWYGGFSDYIEYSEYVLYSAENGQVVDIYYNEEPVDIGAEAYVFAGVAGLIIAIIMCSAYKSQMNTAITAAHAEEYVVENDIDMLVHQDIFTHITTSRVRINTNTNSGGSRGGTSINSRGFSSKSGKY